MLISPRGSETHPSFFLFTWTAPESFPGRILHKENSLWSFRAGRNHCLHGNSNSHRTITLQQKSAGRGEAALAMVCLTSAWHHHLAVVSTAMHLEIHWVQNVAQGDQPGKASWKYSLLSRGGEVFWHGTLHPYCSFLPLYAKLQGSSCRVGWVHPSWWSANTEPQGSMLATSKLLKI